MADNIGTSHISNNNVLSDEEDTPPTTDETDTAQGRNDNGHAGHSCCITPQQAMAKLLFIFEVLNVKTDLNVTARLKMK
jgi:hypothetical protein